MGTILTRAHANHTGLSRRGSAQFIAGLAALLIGGASIMGRAAPPDVQVDPVVPTAAVLTPPADGLDAAWHEVARTPRSSADRLTGIDMDPERAREDPWDMRWDLMEMAAAQRRDSTLRCPCPAYYVKGPHAGPR